MAWVMNPATGRMEDNSGKDPTGGLVSQQESAAATSPTFVNNGPPMDPENVPTAPGPNDVMPMTPDETGLAPAVGDLPPPPGMPMVSIPDETPISTTLADASQANAPILDEPMGLPGPAEPLQLSDVGTGTAPPTGPGPGEVIPMSPDEGTPALPGTGPDVVKPGEVAPPKTLTDERIDAAHREGEVKAEVAKIEADKAQADLDQKVAAKQEEDQIIARSEQRVAEGRARRDAEYTKYKDMTVQDAWGDHGTAKRILAALAMILGGRNGMAVAIGAAQGLEEKKKTELALQERVMANAGKSLEEIKDKTAEDMADFKTRQAASFGVTAARLEQEKRAQGIPEAKIATDKDVLALRAEEQKGKAAAQKLAIDTENERLKMDLTKAQTRQANSAADKNDRYVQKGGRGGGGASGGLAQISDFIKKNPDDQPGAYALAEKLGYRGAKGAALVDKLQNDYKKGAGDKANPATALRRERVAANIHEFNVNADKIKDNVITPEVLQKVQNNETRMEGAAHSGAITQVGGRFLGLVPKSKFDGLTDEQVTAMRAMEAMLQHGSEMQPTTGAEVSHQWKNTYRPTPGMSQGEINASIHSIKDMGPSFRKIIDPTDIGARANAPETTPGAPPSAPVKANTVGGPQTQRPAQGTINSVRAVAADPRAPKERRDQAKALLDGWGVSL